MQRPWLWRTTPWAAEIDFIQGWITGNMTCQNTMLTRDCQDIIPFPSTSKVLFVFAGLECWREPEICGRILILIFTVRFAKHTTTGPFWILAFKFSPIHILFFFLEQPDHSLRLQVSPFTFTSFFGATSVKYIVACEITDPAHGDRVWVDETNKRWIQPPNAER